MITLKTHGRTVLDIDKSAFQKILNVYPDELLSDRSIFMQAYKSNEISFHELKKECETLCLPWQLFLLEPTRLDKEILELNKLRRAKFNSRLIASRDNEGSGISLRIADRLIALQDYAKTYVPNKNMFCGSLIKIEDEARAEHILKYFEIDPDRLNRGYKERTLDYLIAQIEKKNIRISRGVMNSNKLLPIENRVRKTYRKSSGFIVRDDKVPYIFLPSEINDNETPGRQILTLFALLTLAGLEEYNVYIDGSFETKIRANSLLKRAFRVASEVLLPVEISNELVGTTITDVIRDELAGKYMLTPSALIVTLRQRDVIETDEEAQTLLDSIQHAPPSGDPKPLKMPRIETSVKKLCGTTTCADIINGVRTGNLTSIRAQYLMFGYVDKLKFEKFKANVGL